MPYPVVDGVLAPLVSYVEGGLWCHDDANQP